MSLSQTGASGPSPLQLFLVGAAFMGVFGAMLLLPGQGDEASLLTRVTFFIGLIPPPVCFAAGLGMALCRGFTSNVVGAWVNGGALLLHGLLMVLIMSQVLG